MVALPELGYWWEVLVSCVFRRRSISSSVLKVASRSRSCSFSCIRCCPCSKSFFFYGWPIGFSGWPLRMSAFSFLSCPMILFNSRKGNLCKMGKFKYSHINPCNKRHVTTHQRVENIAICPYKCIGMWKIKIL